MKKSFIISCLLINSYCVIAQTLNNPKTYNPIETAVPSLIYPPDATGLALGNCGVATKADVYSSFYNPAKLAFAKARNGFGITYYPQNAKISSSNNNYTATGYITLSSTEKVSLNINYMSLGSVKVLDANRYSLGTVKPTVYSIGGTYSKILGDIEDVSVNRGKDGIGISFKYINSNIGSGQSYNLPYNSTYSIAGDIGYYYDSKIDQNYNKYLFGVSIVNIGKKMNYFDNQKYNLPTQLRIGCTYLKGKEENINYYFGTLEFKKLLVPTPPIYNSTGNIIEGNDPSNTSVVTALVSNFHDAPGGFRQTLSQIETSLGGGYSYQNKFGFYVGLDYQSVKQGSIQTFNIGAGIKTKSTNIIFTSVNPLTYTAKYRQAFVISASFTNGFW